MNALPTVYHHLCPVSKMIETKDRNTLGSRNEMALRLCSMEDGTSLLEGVQVDHTQIQKYLNA